ncbi:MAG TPA: hypothetical protein VEC99_03305 [Clostridia bacterium]|nr:hypothetical protein [Clostridia bacterium]
MSPEALYNALIQIQSLVEEVEESTSDRISWPLVSYCDHIWKQFFPAGDDTIFYSLTTLHNYTISSFTNRLANRLYHVLPNSEVEAIIGKKRLYCLQLASLEDENLPLYANIGHEFGHALWWSEEATLLGLLRKECNAIIQGVFRHLHASDAALAAKRTQRTLWIIRAVAIELFCDLVGAHIAGPAFLLSLQEMGWGTNQDTWSATLVPKDEGIRGYPSFKFRLAAVKKWVGIDVFGTGVRRVFQELFDDPLKELSTYLSSIETDHSADRVRVSAIPDSDADRKAIEGALVANLVELKAALDRFLAKCKSDFLPKYQGFSSFVPVSDEDVSHLLRRLASDVLPNIIPDGTLLGNPAGFATILNASALYRCNLLLKRDQKKGTEEVFREHQKLERLTAKALEVSYIQKQFNDWKARGATP